MDSFHDCPPAHHPLALAQELIRFDTTNPPGNERACIVALRERLAEAGIAGQIFAKSDDRPNLVARLPGRGQSAPLLLYGHVDVVTTENQRWTVAPFEGRVVDGYLWGRGALDMKGGVAMLTAALLAAKRQNLELPGDVILAIVSDEEAGGDFGARFLVENHAEQFQGVRYALGEFGGFTLHNGGKRFYPVQVAEKQICWLKATARGAGGHGSLPVRKGALYTLGRFLQAVTSRRLPVHITPIARQMFGAMADHLGGAAGLMLRQLLNPLLTDRVLDLLGERGRVFDPLLHNSASPTILHASSKVNVIPSEASVELDGRLLPGCQPEDLLRALKRISPVDIEIELLLFDPGPQEMDLGLFDTLGGILRGLDAQAIPVPLLLSGVTDARFFSRLGIQTYGFLPMQLPEGFQFTNVIHAADERIPAQALNFGAEAIFQALQRF